MRKHLFVSLLLLLSSQVFIKAQDSSQIFFTTGAGYLLPNLQLNRILQSSVAFNSGIELSNRQLFFLQGTLDFNTLKYDQQITDEESSYLLQNSNSSLLMLGINGGKNFRFTKRWVFSGYIGGGYLNIGEPRAQVFAGNIVKQSAVRTGNIFGRVGSRLIFDTRSKLLHHIYADVNWWTSPIKIQNAPVNGFGFFGGIRMPM